jgi:hypothetical protein
MDKTIKYSEDFIKIQKQTTVEPDDNVLDKIEREYGKNFDGAGFALEEYKQNGKNINTINDSRSEKRL